MSGVVGQAMTISDQVARFARATPDAPALSFDGVEVTYRELDERAARLAGALLARGVGAGDRVAVLAHNGLEIVETYVACARLAAICVPVNFRLVVPEVRHQLEDSGAVAAVVDEALAPVLLEAWGPGRVVLVVGAAPPGAERYADAVAAVDPATVDRPDVDDEAAAFLLYTSGTTGRPKGAVLTHRNLAMQVLCKSVHIGLPASCRTWLIATPLFHVAGLAATVTGLFAGGRVVVGRSVAFDPAALVDQLERERITTCFLVPAQWQAVCDLPGIAERDLSALQIASWGGAPATAALLRRMVEILPFAQVNTAFGQTETCATATVLHGVDALRKIGSVGRPMLGVEVRVVDQDMHDVPRGTVGEIVYRGPSVMREYWNRPAETAEAFAGGWFHSGDLVREDEEGFLYVVDRAKDMIISGGENIYSLEVEQAVAAHPAVAEVAVVGIPDERWGETPLAVVVPVDPAAPPTAEEITIWCRARLAAYKCPRVLLIVDRLPRNPSGKVRKAELRETALVR